MLHFAWLQARENVRQTNTMAIQTQRNKTPTPCPGYIRGSSSWQAESALPGWSHTRPSPQIPHQRKLLCLEGPILWEEATKASLHHPSLVFPHVSIPELQNWRGRHHIRRRKFPFSLQPVPAQAIFRLFLLFLRLSSQSCSWRIRAALRAPGGIAVEAEQQWCDSITSSWESPGLLNPGSEINRVERLKGRNYVGNGPDWTR